MEPVRPLYSNIYELIEFRGIKQGAIAQAINMSYNNWYKSRLKGLRNLSIEEIHRLALFLNLPPQEVFSLCLAVYKNNEAERAAESID